MTQIVVFSTFDITPTIDGGRTRYTEIYKRLAEKTGVTLLAYVLDPGPARRYDVADNFHVEVYGADPADREQLLFGMQHTGLYLHDALCIEKYALTGEFVDAMKSTISRADIVISAHPYLAPLIFSLADKGQLRVYESFNVEADVKREYFADSTGPTITDALLGDVVNAERFATEAAHVVTAVSREDADRLRSLYGVEDHIHVVPNGVDAEPRQRFDGPDLKEFRQSVGAGPETPLAVFLGSAYPGNVDSYRRTRAWLEQAGFDGTVVVIGSIANADVIWPQVTFREVWLGYVSQEVKSLAIAAADFALHFIFTGGGTNLKLFDYMASGTFILANDFGARGVGHEGWYYPVNSSEDLRIFLAKQGWRAAGANDYREAAKKLADEEFSWTGIADRFGRILGVG